MGRRGATKEAWIPHHVVVDLGHGTHHAEMQMMRVTELTELFNKTVLNYSFDSILVDESRPIWHSPLSILSDFPFAMRLSKGIGFHSGCSIVVYEGNFYAEIFLTINPSRLQEAVRFMERCYRQSWLFDKDVPANWSKKIQVLRFYDLAQSLRVMARFRSEYSFGGLCSPVIPKLIPLTSYTKPPFCYAGVVQENLNATQSNN